MRDLEVKKLLLTCPGDTIQETINEIVMSQAELAERLGRSIPKLNELIKGKTPLTKETALKLEHVLGIPAKGWLSLEEKYQEQLVEIEKLEFYETCLDWLKHFPVSTMKKLGILPETNDKPVLAEALLKFFRVASPNEWKNIYKESSLAFKIDLRPTSEAEAISVWLRLGEIQANKVKVSDFDKKKFREKLPGIKELSFLLPDDWQAQLQNICAECGIALVYTPCIVKAPILGATHWVKNFSLPILQMTDRFKSPNAFWFTFYHESAHLLYHGKKDIFIEGLDNIKGDSEKEKEADTFAERTLIKDSQMNEILESFSFPIYKLQEFSVKFRIHQSIIVSQLQRRDVISYKNYKANKLKERLELEYSEFN